MGPSGTVVELKFIVGFWVFFHYEAGKLFLNSRFEM